MKLYEGLCNQKSEVLLESLPLSRGSGLKMWIIVVLRLEFKKVPQPLYVIISKN